MNMDYIVQERVHEKEECSNVSVGKPGVLERTGGENLMRETRK
jgi:hypothetical protein